MITLEQLEQYKQTEIKLARICAEWAKQKLEDWQHYGGYYIKNECIIIKYSYNDIVNNIEYETCYGSKCVSWQDIIEFAKTLEL